MFVKQLKAFLNKYKDKYPVKTRINFETLYNVSGDPWGTVKYDRRLNLALSLIKDFNLNNKNCLDIGCSYGQFLEMIISRYKNARCYGIDIANKPIKFLLKSKNIKAKLGNMINIPYKKNMFKYIFCLEVLYYIENKPKAIFEVSRVLEKNGIFLLGLTFGKNYFHHEKDVFFLLKDKFDILNRKIILPKPFPTSLPLLGDFFLLFARYLPSFYALKGYYLLKKNK